MSRINRISPPNKIRIIAENNITKFRSINQRGQNIIDAAGISRNDWGILGTYSWQNHKSRAELTPFIQSYSQEPKKLTPQNFVASLLYLASNDPIDMQHWQAGSNFTILCDMRRIDFTYSDDQFSQFREALKLIGNWKLDMNDLLYDMALYKKSYNIGKDYLPNSLFKTIMDVTKTDRVRIFMA